MRSVVIKQSGSLKHIEGFFHKDRTRRVYQLLNEYGRRGVELLRDATPNDSGKTASGWDYEIQTTSSGISLPGRGASRSSGRIFRSSPPRC